MSPRQPIKSSDLDKSRMKHGGLRKKHFCKKSNIPNDSAEIVNFHFYHYKSMETLSCHSNQSSNPAEINQRTNGPVNAHLISGPTVSTQTNKIGQGQPRVIIFYKLCRA